MFDIHKYTKMSSYYSTTSSSYVNNNNLNKNIDINTNNTAKTTQPTQPTIYQQVVQNAVSSNNNLSQTVSSNIIVKKNPGKPDELNTDDFVDLDFVDVQINLQFLSVLKENEKIMILENKHMQVDKRQSIMRYLYSDSRQKTMRFINHVVECAKKYCKDEKDKTFKNTEKLSQIKKLLENSLDGLRNLLTTYKTDKNICSIIKIYETNIDTFCKTELAKTVV